MLRSKQTPSMARRCGSVTCSAQIFCYSCLPSVHLLVPISYCYSPRFIGPAFPNKIYVTWSLRTELDECSSPHCTWKSIHSSSFLSHRCLNAQILIKLKSFPVNFYYYIKHYKYENVKTQHTWNQGYRVCMYFKSFWPCTVLSGYLTFLPSTLLYNLALYMHNCISCVWLYTLPLTVGVTPWKWPFERRNVSEFWCNIHFSDFP